GGCRRPAPPRPPAPGQQLPGRPDPPEAGEVALDDDRADVAEGLGLDVVLDELAKPRAAVDAGAAPPGLRTAEETEPHQAAPFCWNQARRRCQPSFAGVSR